MASESARTAAASRQKTEWWSREVELVQRLQALREQTGATLAGDTVLPAVEWDAPWRSAEVISILTHLCIDRLRQHQRQRQRRRPGALRSDPQPAAARDGLVSVRHLDAQPTTRRLRHRAEQAAGNAEFDGADGERLRRTGVALRVSPRGGVQGGEPRLEAAHPAQSRLQAAATGSWFSDWINKTVPLVDTAPEAEMLSRRRPSLVYDTSNAPVYRPLIVAAGQSRSYVVAPLVHGDDVIGFLHTDHHPLDRRVDESDRDVLWAFADGFSHIYERMVLLERLRTQRDSVRDLFFGAVDRIDDLCESGGEAARAADDEGHDAARQR